MQPPAEPGMYTASLPADTLPENIPLYLPSSLPSHIRALPELEDICQLEWRLREPQAEDALAEIRRQRRVIQGLWHFKKLNMSETGNRPNTKMLTLYKRFENKTQRAAEKYRSAWRALSRLDPNGSWSGRLKELKKEHISGPGREPNDVSNSRYQPTWIWLVPCVNGLSNSETTLGEEEFNKGMRVEWAKARARMRRWKEELLIVQEEMRRVVVYHQWKADWWCDRSTWRSHADASIMSGVSGYAHKQAAICRRMAERCAVHWLPHLKGMGVTPEWAGDYEHLLHQHSDSESMNVGADTDMETFDKDDMEDNEGEIEDVAHENIVDDLNEENYLDFDD